MRCEDVIRELAVPGQGQDAAALAEHIQSCSMCAAWSARMSSFDQLWAQTRPADPSPEQWDAVWNRISRSLDATPARSREVAESSLPLQAPHSPIRLAPGTASVDGNPAMRPLEVQRGTVPIPAQPTLVTWFLSKSLRQRVLIATSAAAVYLVACGLVLFSPAPRTQVQAPPAFAQVEPHGGPVDSSIAPTVIGSVDIEEGELVVIRTSNPQAHQAVPEYEIVRSEPDAGIDSWYVMFNAVESMANPVVAVR